MLQSFLVTLGVVLAQTAHTQLGGPTDTAAYFTVVGPNIGRTLQIAGALLHDRERLLRRGPHLHQERVRCRRHGAWPVRQDRV